MAPLLKSLLGNGSKDRELTDEMRAILNEMQQERSRYEAMVHKANASADRLQELGEPVAKAASDAASVMSRLEELEQRLAGITRLAEQVQPLGEQAESLAQNQQQVAAQAASTLAETQQIRAVFEDLSQKVDLAVSLKDRLGSFLEVEKPFEQLRGEFTQLRGHVDGTGDQLTRLREQHDRLMDAHKLAMSKMEALDRRRDDLGRSLQDKERRVLGVEQAVRGMDGVQRTVEDMRREIGTLKALGDTVVQKSAALMAQRDAAERALASAEQLDRAMRQIDAGVRQQQENEKSLHALQDQVGSLRSLHERVVERSGEISQVQHEAEEATRQARQDLASMTDEMRKTVERFDFEGRGLESVNQRVADLRGSLSDFESRYKALSESRQAAAELKAQTQTVGDQLRVLSEEVGQVGNEIQQLRTIRRDLDETGRTARDIGAMVSRIEQSRPAVEVALRDIEQLSGAHALVRDALEQARLAQDELARMRASQSETHGWLENVERLAAELREQVSELNLLAPNVEQMLKQAQRIDASTAEFEARREFVDGLGRRLHDIGTLGASLDERGQQLQARMDATEQRFTGLEAQSEAAERLSGTMGAVSSQVREAGRRSAEIKKTVTAIGSRCDSIDELAEKTRALQQELEQRQKGIAEATKEFQHAAELRQKAAVSAKQLDEVAGQLTTALSSAEERVTQVSELSNQLEDRAARLRSVEQRLGQFEARLAQWDLVEQEVARSLEQIVARQGTVEALQADLDRMAEMAENTAKDVRQITSARDDIESSRKQLAEVSGRLQEVRDTTKGLDERERQMGRAEERLSRAEALLSDVGSSLEVLQGQKAIVDLAVEKAGSLQFLLKQAETTIESLREEREITGRVRTAVAVVRHADDEDDMEQAKAA